MFHSHIMMHNYFQDQCEFGCWVTAGLIWVRWHNVWPLTSRRTWFSAVPRMLLATHVYVPSSSAWARLISSVPLMWLRYWPPSSPLPCPFLNLHRQKHVGNVILKDKWMRALRGWGQNQYEPVEYHANTAVHESCTCMFLLCLKLKDSKSTHEKYDTLTSVL